MRGEERLVGDLRARRPHPMSSRERVVVAALALLYAAAASAAATLFPWDRHPAPIVVAGVVVMFALVSRVEFEVGSNMAVATSLVFLPMLFLLPLPLVPILIPAAYALSMVPDFLKGKKHPDRWVYAMVDAWFCLGPVVVLALLGDEPASFSRWATYAAAFCAQVVCDAVPAAVRGRLVRGLRLRENVVLLGWVQLIDAALWPIGLALAVAAQGEPGALLSVGPFVWMLSTFSRERRERHSAALELNRAYRGTVMLLSDVVEADDNYTADHCRGVVELVNAVADELEIDPDERQELEFAALLHDVGKIVIPKEIINKPGALNDDEFELMKTHTIEGQVLLDRVGGLLGRVGTIVRSCHERWDGNGYPDGLAGYEIPLAARIVFACDAYSAMTTDRPYRAAMSRETALEELWANAGSQFDPRIVAALATVVRRGPLPDERSTAQAVREVLIARQLAETSGLPEVRASESR